TAADRREAAENPARWAPVAGLPLYGPHLGGLCRGVGDPAVRPTRYGRSAGLLPRPLPLPSDLSGLGRGDDPTAGDSAGPEPPPPAPSVSRCGPVPNWSSRCWPPIGAIGAGRRAPPRCPRRRTPPPRPCLTPHSSSAISMSSPGSAAEIILTKEYRRF